MFNPFGMFNGAIHGFERGLQYDVDEVKMIVEAVESGDAQRISDTMDVLKTWLSEIADEAGNVKHGMGSLVINFMMGGGHDPFAGSRHKLQELETKYGKP